MKLLQKELKCKNIWVEKSFKYANPDEDLPQNFQKNKSTYCKILNVSSDGKNEIQTLKSTMLKTLETLNANIPHNSDVRIGSKSGKAHIYITPYEKQDEPHNIDMLKQEIRFLWPNISLLDVLKEADLRIGLMDELINMAGKIGLDKTILQQRLLVCLFAIGTNTEFKKICVGMPDMSESDLFYVKKRFITVAGLRYVIGKLVNATLEIRDKSIWGSIANTFASDSTKFASWSDNLMSEYHIRYKGYGIMAYWHVERKALCVSSQVMRCSSSEVATMLLGVIHHSTHVKVEKHSTDTHGQSLVAFAFTYLLGIELRPRIKGIGRLKLNKADNNIPKSSYNHLEPVMAGPIDWKLIIENYDELLRYVIALKLRTAEPEILLKRFIVENKQNPVYKACIELGKAVRTIHICSYLHSKEMRMEIEEVLNVIENWHSGNNFIFHGKRGIISSNDETDQEISILGLHLLQSSLAYINTLMIQKVEKTKEWKDRLTTEDKRAITPLFNMHINQYGLFKLDMNERIHIEDLCL